MLSKGLVISRFSYTLRSPLDLQLFKSQENLQKVRTSLSKRYRNPDLADQISQNFQEHKKMLYELEQLNKSINIIQKNIKDFFIDKQAKNKDKVDQWKRQIEILKKKQKVSAAQVKELGDIIQEKIFKVGNLVDVMTPVSQDEADNEIIRMYQPKRGIKQFSKSYSEICEKANITDLARGQKVSGHRGYFLKTNGVKLALGLIQYAFDFLEEHGYSIYQSPAIITGQTLRASCQLQSISQDVYKLENSPTINSKENNHNYLIGTSQQSLAGYYKDQVLDKQLFPIRMGGYSTCFRKQAGAHGKDIHGLFRVHQFEKIQQFCLTQSNQSSAQMNRMIGISEEFYKSLEIPYRIVNIVSGQLNDAATCKLDLQAWYPSQQKYRQLVSVSNCTDYQSRLLKVQYLDANNQHKYVYMLNGTLVAVQRTITCLLENYNHENFIEIPEVLKKYINCDKFEYK